MLNKHTDVMCGKTRNRKAGVLEKGTRRKEEKIRRDASLEELSSDVSDSNSEISTTISK